MRLELGAKCACMIGVMRSPSRWRGSTNGLAGGREIDADDITGGGGNGAGADMHALLAGGCSSEESQLKNSENSSESTLR